MVRKLVRFTTDTGRGSFELNKDTPAALYEKVRRLAQLSGESKRKGVVIDDVDKVAIRKLPSDILNQFIANGLCDGVQSKKIPTLSVFLDKAIPVTGTKRTQDKRNQYRDYLLEYHGDKRVDLIDAVEAYGIIRYFSQERDPAAGQLLAQYTIGRAITSIRSYFDMGVKWGYFKENPYADVPAVKRPNKKKRCYVTRECIKPVLDCLKDVELEGILAISRFGGLRGESEWQDLRFSDFKPEGDGLLTFRVPDTGKTGERFVPVFEEFRPYYDALIAVRYPGQEFVFENRRKCKNVRPLIKKAAKKAGISLWADIFTNCRRSFIKDKRAEGFTEQELTMMVGNSATIRSEYYDLGMTRSEVAAWSLRSSGGVLVPVSPKSAPESAPLPTFEKHWSDLFYDGTSDVEIVYQMLVMVGWSEKRAREIAENDKATMTVAKDLRRCFQRVSDYMAGRISRFELIVTQLGFIVRSYWGLITRHPIWMALADKKFTEKRAEKYLLAGAGLEPALPYGKGILNP